MCTCLCPAVTLVTVWLIETGIAVSHSRPCHPQTLGKDERFHRSLKAEALQGPPFADLAKAQAFDRWRHVYNRAASSRCSGRRRAARPLPGFAAPVSAHRVTAIRLACRQPAKGKGARAPHSGKARIEAA
ncbi:transposase [Sinorhizobium terangae]|uniref:Transposase n=1 Tax=Sinorhizobium terangae TaxID=110322 RepID=A0A6N7LL74_SINTE|nr:transposase [Sinorhizobium terangae]